MKRIGHVVKETREEKPGTLEIIRGPDMTELSTSYFGSRIIELCVDVQGIAEIRKFKLMIVSPTDDQNKWNIVGYFLKRDHDRRYDGVYNTTSRTGFLDRCEGSKN